jgi:hypothetical protein
LALFHTVEGQLSVRSQVQWSLAMSYRVEVREVSRKCIINNYYIHRVTGPLLPPVNSNNINTRSTLKY